MLAGTLTNSVILEESHLFSGLQFLYLYSRDDSNGIAGGVVVRNELMCM